MKIEMDVISRQVITPSSPTPPHLNNYKLSYIDQIMIPFLMPHVFFYPLTEKNPISYSERLNQLKKSLSKALTLFYPLAGRLVDNSYVDCNDEGVTFVEAHANCNLRDVINIPLNAEEVNNKFLPCEPEDGKDLCLVVQATSFSCGGLAIGVAITHKLVDGMSYFKFVNTWAALSRGDDSIQSPIFASAPLFPARDLGERVMEKVKKETIATKRFVFNGEMVSKLRDKYSNNTNNEGFIRPTRVETLSAFISTRFLVATSRAKDDSCNTYASTLTSVGFSVGIRTKVVPPLSDNHFGNFFLRIFAAPSSLKNDDESKYGFVKNIRDAIRSVDQDYVAKIPERDESIEAIMMRCGVKKDSGDEAVYVRITSVCGLPRYDSDFGWGKPVWVGSGKIPFTNTVFFMDSISGGGGIDALVYLNVEEMKKFEADEELNQYVTK